jgi:hypothetical protein
MKKKILFALLIYTLALCYPITSISGMVSKKRCQIHGEILKKVHVPIVYGLVINIEQPAARRELFPNANRVVYGGCEWDASYPKESEVYYCYECRVAQYKYYKAMIDYAHKNGKLPESGWWRTAQSNNSFNPSAN